MKKPFTVYLDSNVLIQVCDGSNENLRAIIDSSIAENKLTYPFSAEQINELTSSGTIQQITTRLEYLSEISQNIYFCNSITELGFGNQTPQAVHETISEVNITDEMQQILNILVTHEQRLKARSSLGLSPNVLNNMNGKEAVTAIDLALLKLAPPDQDLPRSLKELMVWSERFMPPELTGFGEPSRFKTQYEKRNQDIAALFSFLDSFGYWPDDERAIRRGSDSKDGIHVVNASFFNVLVSADKKLRGKAEAVYQILELHTHVLSVEEFMRLEVINDG